MIQRLTNDEFKASCKVRMNNILEGFDNFNNITLSFEDYNSYINYIHNLFYRNNSIVIIDFYFNKLNNESFNMMLNSLSLISRELIQTNFSQFLNDHYIYFKINDISILDALIELNYKGIFYTNFYFTKDNITCWPSFNKEVIEFNINF